MKNVRENKELKTYTFYSDDEKLTIRKKDVRFIYDFLQEKFLHRCIVDGFATYIPNDKMPSDKILDNYADSIYADIFEKIQPAVKAVVDDEVKKYLKIKAC